MKKRASLINHPVYRLTLCMQQPIIYIYIYIFTYTQLSVFTIAYLMYNRKPQRLATPIKQTRVIRKYIYSINVGHYT